MRCAGVSEYSAAPTRRATFERAPSAPTTRGAYSAPAVVSTPTTRPSDSIRLLTVVPVLISAPAAAAAWSRVASHVQHRGAQVPVEARHLDADVVEGQEPVLDRFGDSEYRLEHAELIQDLHPGGLDPVGRRGVAGKHGAIDQTDVQSAPAEQRRQRRAGTPGTHDDDVELVGTLL